MMPNPAVARTAGVASTGQPLAPPGSGGRMSTACNNYEAHRKPHRARPRFGRYAPGRKNGVNLSRRRKKINTP